MDAKRPFALCHRRRMPGRWIHILGPGLIGDLPRSFRASGSLWLRLPVQAVIRTSTEATHRRMPGMTRDLIEPPGGVDPRKASMTVGFPDLTTERVAARRSRCKDRSSKLAQ